MTQRMLLMTVVLLLAVPASAQRMIHVSSLADPGGDGSEARPLRTIDEALGRMRHEQGDRILIRRGETHRIEQIHWKWSGRAGAAAGVGAWGEGPAPVIESDRDGLVISGGGGSPARIDHVLFEGFVLRARRNEELERQNGILWLLPGRDITLRDLTIDGYRFNIVFQNGRDVLIERCRVLNAHPRSRTTGHSSGIYADWVRGLEIRDSWFVNNGWKDDRSLPEAAMQNHNLYIQSTCRDVVVRRNLIAEGASHGIQLRCGGTIEDNVLVRNAIAIYLSGPAKSIIRGNVVIEGIDINPALPRGWGIEVNHQFGVPESVLIENNIFARNLTAARQWSFAMKLTEKVTARTNVLYDWPGISRNGAVVEANVVNGTHPAPERTVDDPFEDADIPAVLAHVREGFLFNAEEPGESERDAGPRRVRVVRNLVEIEYDDGEREVMQPQNDITGAAGGEVSPRASEREYRHPLLP